MNVEEIDMSQNSITDLFSTEIKSVFKVPKYQREYKWGSKNWGNLFDDLLENDSGYFLGSIICVNLNPANPKFKKYEVVDGQQRLISISLLLSAIYRTLKKNEKELNSDQIKDMVAVIDRLVLKGTKTEVRVTPQSQNNNDKDYKGQLAAIGIIPHQAMPKNSGNRRIVKAYKYFEKRINDALNEADDKISKAFEILDKVNKAIMVLIAVPSYADAFMLFESLNNRGLPLTSVDIIKNLLLAQLDKAGNENMEYYFSQWNEILGNLGAESSEQERFFRQNYNAFRSELNNFVDKKGEGKVDRQYPLGAVATRSTLLDIYQKIIEADPIAALDEIYENAEIYGSIISQEEDGIPEGRHEAFLDLQRVQGAPSYLLIMYLIKKQEALGIKDADIIKVCQLLVRFFVHRNVTNVPPTRDMNRLFMMFVEQIERNNYRGDDIYANIWRGLCDVSASDEVFKERLCGPIYTDNKNATRFILCTMAKRGMTRENSYDLWKKTGDKQYVWSIEHIFPQGSDIKMWWVEMVADGDEKKAKEYQEQYVHTFGNLTITGYNSKLSYKRFQEKKELKDSEGNDIGFNNGLNLNADVCDKDEWTVEAIQNRTKRMVDEIMEIFAL